MLAGELREIILQYPGRIDDIRSLLHIADLDEKTFLQVSGPHSRRVELLYKLQHIQHFLLVRLDPGPESQVIHKTVYIPAEIPVIIQASYNEGGHLVLMVRQVPESQLVHQTLRKALLDRESIVLGALVLAVVVDPELIARDGVVLLVIRKRHLPWLVLIILIPLLGHILIKHRVLLQLLPDTLLEFLGRKLDELDGLDLQRRQFLRLLQF